jgi:hypothetical protein
VLVVWQLRSRCWWQGHLPCGDGGGPSGTAARREMPASIPKAESEASGAASSTAPPPDDRATAAEEELSTPR